MRRTINDEKLTAYILGELNDIERKEVEKALEGDPSSRQVMAELERAAELSRLAFANSSASGLGLTDDQRTAVLRSAEGMTPIEPEAEPEPRMSGIFHDTSEGGLFGGAGADLGDSPFDLSGGIFTSVGAGEGSIGEKPETTSVPEPIDEQEDDIEIKTRSPRIDAEDALTGRRSENSVLFSLSNLQALAMADKAGELPRMSGGADDESSGLIDIRTLSQALSTSSDDRADDLMSLGAGGFAPIAPAQSRRLSLSAKLAIAGGGVALAAAAVFVFAFSVFHAKDEDEIEMSSRIAMLEKQISELSVEEAAKEPAPLTQKKASLKTAAAPEKEEKVEDINALAETDKVSEKAAYTGKKSAKSAAKKSKSKGGEYKDTSKSKSSTSKSSGGEAPATSKSGGSDELDDLLGGAASNSPKPSKSPANNAASSAPGSAVGGGGSVKKSLDRSDVQKGMSAVAPRVKKCGQGQSGTITLKVIIGSTGKVVSASPTGAFAGTPVGSCAARAVRAARFPKSQSSLSVMYPFKL